jgi:predicted MFS family arabinose efflux permease
MPLSLDDGRRRNGANNQAGESAFLFAPSDADVEDWERQLVEPLLTLESFTSSPLMPSHHASTPDEQGYENDDNDEDDAPSDAGILFFKCVYFFRGLSASTWGRFGVIYYNRVQHLSNEKIGILQSVWPLIGVISMPFWGYMADVIQSRKRIFVLCKILSTLSLLALSLDRIHSFPWILLCVSGTSLFRASGVLDAHTIDFLGETHRTSYGSIRLYTALSWGLGAVILGTLTDTFGFRINFWLFGFMMTTEVILTGK